jgi:PE-PPE domain/PE family
MTNVIIEALTQAAADVGNIETALEEANAVAVPPTTSMLAPGADEVSAAITALFNGHAQAYQELAAQATAFHRQFTALLAQAGAAYQNTEQASEQLLRDTVTKVEQPLAPLLPSRNTTPVPPTVPTNSSVGLILGGTDEPFTEALLQQIPSLYNLPTNSNSLLYTPEQLWPLTPQYGGLTLGQSVAQGVSLLNNAIHTQLGAGNSVTVWGTSQSSIIITEEIRNLMAAGSPDASKLSFVLTGNPNNPNGGILERFTGYYTPGLDILFNGATPAGSPYVTAIYTNQYDPISDFPQYPLNAISDLNAIMGGCVGQHFYAYPLNTYYQLPTSPGYTGNTTYYMRLDQTLPLVQPLRRLGTTGNAIADLLQPDLRVIVDMGYGSNEYANLPTPAQLLEIPNIPVIVHDLATGTVQGVNAFGVDMGSLPQSDFPNAYPYLPALDPQLNFTTGQPSVTGISLLTGAQHQLMNSLGLIPEWDQ